MTPQDVELVQSTFEKVRPISQQAAGLFYGRLFEIAPEVKPLYGNFVVFKRADNSFHGHLPFEGERRVIQVAWLTSENEKLRKTKRGKLSRLFKKLFGSVDKRIGADRADDAAHKD